AATCLRRADRVNRTFHRVSLTIYCLWLLAFISGAIAGMLKLAR
ncbi:MAG TPA: TIGR03987 family protein, partial [Geobacteraceae bacterium]